MPCSNLPRCPGRGVRLPLASVRPIATTRTSQIRVASPAHPAESGICGSPSLEHQRVAAPIQHRPKAPPSIITFSDAHRQLRRLRSLPESSCLLVRPLADGPASPPRQFAPQPFRQAFQPASLRLALFGGSQSDQGDVPHTGRAGHGLSACLAPYPHRPPATEALEFGLAHHGSYFLSQIGGS